jgi:ubiquinone/menaquinone biosynthesis C-methylase UbiE
MVDPRAYCCTVTGCQRAALVSGDSGLSCANGHFFPYAPGTRVPVFAKEPDGENAYAIPNAAEVHDNALRWVFATFGTDEASLRERLAARLKLCRGQKLLVTGAGTGNDLPYLAQGLDGAGEIYAQDIAQQMLLTGVKRHQSELDRSEVGMHFSVSDAMNLPFTDGYFDAAYHFGGINLFADIRQGIAEMARVVRTGGKVVIGDEGIAPWLRETELGEMLIRNNPLFACDIPLSLLPDSAWEVRLSWELSNCFYVIEFSVAAGPPHINIDVPHVGKRGGSIRTRYFGQLEGVDPALRDRVYAEAERLGMSRVEYLEKVLRGRLSKR